MRFSARVLEVRPLSGALFVLRLEGCERLEGALAGQFAMLRGDWGMDPVTPRAMSVMHVRSGVAEFLIKEVGRGTRMLRRARAGESVDVLGPLGRGFPDLEDDPVLVAGGVGLPPLLRLAEQARVHDAKRRISFYYGARTAEELVLVDELRVTGAHVVLVTEDGSMGSRGRVTDHLSLGARSTIYACGPNPMLRAVREAARKSGARCWLSIEERMACAVRACLGCAVPAAGEAARARPYLYVCTDGPVFEGETIWP